jgi:hypothetical protein
MGAMWVIAARQRMIAKLFTHTHIHTHTHVWIDHALYGPVIISSGQVAISYTDLYKLISWPEGMLG